MCFTIIANDAASVDSKNHWQVLEANIVYNLVKSALQKGRVYSHNRYKALGGQSGGKGNRVLLTDAHIKHALRKLSLKNAQAIPFWHSRGDCHQSWIFTSQAKHSLGKYLAVSWYFFGASIFFSGHTMEINSVTLRRKMAFAFGGYNMNKSWLEIIISCLGKGSFKVGNIVPVNRS